MEYPFKDLLPLDEVLEREGYYKDWTHLDPKVFYSLTQISEYIKTKGYGVDVRLLIAQLAEHFSLKTSQINQIERLFNDVMKELSEDKEFYSLPEIAGARGGFGTLGERLNSEVFDMSRMGQDIKEAMTGGSVAVVGRDAITSENVISNTLLFSDIKSGGLLPNYFIFDYNVSARNRTRSSENFISGGVTIKTKEKSIDIYIEKIVGEDVTNYSGGWSSDDVYIDSDGIYNVRARKKDDSDFTQLEISELSKVIVGVTDSSFVSANTLDDSLTTNLQYQTTSSTNRARSFITTVAKDTIIDSRGSNIEFFVYGYDDSDLASGYTNFYHFTSSESMYLHIKKVDDSEFTPEDIENLKYDIQTYQPDDFIKYKNINKVVYISTDGDDSSSGLTPEAPIKTIQKAIDSGATTIKIEPGDYTGQTINAKDMDRLHIYALPSGQHDPLTKEQSTAKLTNGKQIDGLVYSSNMYTGNLTLDTNDFWKEVFIDKSLTPEITDAYVTNDKMITYNAVLWQIDPSNPENTMRLKPVLTLGEVRNNMGTFYYDGSVVHIYPRVSKPDLIFMKGIDRTLTAPTFENIGELIVSDVDFLFQNSGAVVKNVSNYQFTHSDYGYTTENSGFIPSDSNGVNKNSKGYFNQRDGFGPIGRGKMDFEDCYGYYNGDDGISHHSYTTGVIRGGEYHHNQKGGVIPTQNTKVDVHNVISHNNKYGFNFRDGHGQRVNLSNVVAYDNEIGISVKDYDVQMFNGKFENNVMPTEIESTELTKFVDL